jgi:hypothetical protein
MNITLQPRVETRIQIIRGAKVVPDADLAELYGVSTKALNQAVKRNIARFPPDFRFQLDAGEKAEVITNCDHLEKLKFSKVLPHAFTKHGAIQAANVLASPQAIEMGIYVVRAFVHLREMAATHADLSRRFDALRALTARPLEPAKRPIGFVTPEDPSRKEPAS